MSKTEKQAPVHDMPLTEGHGTDEKMASEVLAMEGVCKSFGKLAAVDGLTMKISAGEAVAFIGQNGAGKSTTMRAIAGLTQIDGGSVKIMGHAVDEEPLKARAHLGYVSQDLELYQFLTGEEFLTLAGRIRGLEKEALSQSIDELIELCGLQNARNRMIREYSGGMARKIAMAGALIGKPELVVLDESFVGLDPESTFKIGHYLREYVRGGRSILISSHILEMLYQLCTRFFILHHGKCVADISREALAKICREDPATPDITSYYLRMTGQAELIPSIDGLRVVGVE